MSEWLRITLMTGGVVFWFGVGCATVVYGLKGIVRVKWWWEDREVPGKLKMRKKEAWVELRRKKAWEQDKES